MITRKQKKYYISIIVEIMEANFPIVYERFMLKALKVSSGLKEDKIRAYHMFFKSISKSYPRTKRFEELSCFEFNCYLEDIRIVLSENGYVLNEDYRAFNSVIEESKKTMSFNNYLKVG